MPGTALGNGEPDGFHDLMELLFWWRRQTVNKTVTLGGKGFK